MPTKTSKLRFLDLLLSRKWTENDITDIVGDYKKSWFCHSNDVEVQKNAASGGFVATLLIHLLGTNEIDAAIVCDTVFDNNVMGVQYRIASDKVSVISSQGSVYAKGDFLKDVPNLIRDFKGKLAVVCLPCQAKFLRDLSVRDSVIAENLAFIVTLFCGHNSEKELIQAVIDKKIRNYTGKQIGSFRFRKGFWRGFSQVKFTDRTCMFFPASSFLLYQNLFFFSEKKCLACGDHFGFFGDFCVGDVWLFRMKACKAKHSGVVARTEHAQKIVDDMISSGVLTGEPQSIEQILESQSRTARRHANLTSRAKVGKWFGLHIKDTQQKKTSFPQDLIWFLYLLNWKFGQSKYRNLIFRIPRPVLKLYLYFIKMLESFS